MLMFFLELFNIKNKITPLKINTQDNYIANHIQWLTEKSEIKNTPIKLKHQIRLKDKNFRYKNKWDYYHTILVFSIKDGISEMESDNAYNIYCKTPCNSPRNMLN